jgi:predicted ester cyclase
MQATATRDSNVRAPRAFREGWPELFAATAICGGLVGIAGTSWLILAGLGPFTGGWAAFVAYALTTSSLGGAYALVGKARPRLGAAAALVALAALLAVVSFFAYWQAIRSGPGGGSRFLAVAFWTGYSARPLAVLIFGVVALVSGGRSVKPVGALLIALGALGAAPLAAQAVAPSWYSGSGFGWGGLLLGVPWIGTGLPEAVGWALLGGAIFRSGRGLLAREREERNRRSALKLYEEGLGRGDLSVVDGLVSEDFRDLRGTSGSRGKGIMERLIADLRASYPDLEVSVEGQEAEGDLVRTRLTLSGTDRGRGVLWYPPTGRRVSFSATFVDRFRDGELVEHEGSADTEGLLQQLGHHQEG